MIVKKMLVVNQVLMFIGLATVVAVGVGALGGAKKMLMEKVEKKEA